jgi:hypothetical protein
VSRNVQFVNFENDLLLDKPIYRFMPFLRLIELMTAKKLTLLRTDLWDDPWENYIVQARFTIGSATTRFRFNRRIFGSCWTRKSVSDALWRIYSPDKLAIRIASTPGLLGAALDAGLPKRLRSSWFVGRVQYLPQSEIAKKAADIAYEIARDRSGAGAARSVLFKRRSFAHEDEVRVLVIDPYTSGRQRLLSIEIDPNAVVKSVMIDSRTPKEIAEMYATYLKRSLGFPHRIAKSTLYDLPEDLRVDLGGTSPSKGSPIR